MLNDLIADTDRRAAFVSFASWLRADGVLLADVRDWQATAARYATQSSHDLSVDDAGWELRFSSATSLDHERHVMRVRERYRGTVDGVEVDESYDFRMRCWTPEHVTAYAAEAGFASLDIQRGAKAGVAADRLRLLRAANG